MRCCTHEPMLLYSPPAPSGSSCAAGPIDARSLMAEPMALDTLKLATTAGLGGWLAALQRSPAEVCAELAP